MAKVSRLKEDEVALQRRILKLVNQILAPAGRIMTFTQKPLQDALSHRVTLNAY